MHELSEQGGVLHVTLPDDGVFPNNGRYPVLLYRSVESSASGIETLLHGHSWGGSWRNGIYSMHHYHSTAHEALGVYSGSATVQLGGEGGIILDIEAGDLVVIPAGVAHKRLRSKGSFAVVGAYPDGQRWDMNYGRPGERPETDEKVRRTHRPTMDPVYGKGGPLLTLWPE
jgi:uncharacterized protein YjlB